jgi:SAM-dependent methyltransferase
VAAVSEVPRARRADRLGALRRRLWCRAFSSAEAWVFEAAVAPALAAAVAPSLARELEGPLILDVGCGGGRIALVVAAALDAHVVGVDPSAAQLRRFRRRVPLRGPATAERASVEALPFLAGSFSSLYSSCAFKHWPDPSAALAECSRVLRPGAVLVVVEVDGESTWAEWRAFARRRGVPRGLRSALALFTAVVVAPAAPDEADLVGALERQGLELERSGRLSGLPLLCCVARRR